MEINFNLNAGAVGRTPPNTPVRAAASATESASFSGADALDGALQRAPDVRADVVAQARQYIGDVNYPPRETIRKIAHLLAIRLPADAE